MTILRKTMCGLWLGATLLGLPFAVWAQGEKWTDKECRKEMEALFHTVKTKDYDGATEQVLEHIGPRAVSSFAMNCGIKEANSIRQLNRQLEQMLAEKQRLFESYNRITEAVRNFHMQNFAQSGHQYSQ